MVVMASSILVSAQGLLVLGLGLKGFGAKGLGPGLDNYSKVLHLCIDLATSVNFGLIKSVELYVFNFCILL